MTECEKKSSDIISFKVLLSFMSLQKTKQKLGRRTCDQRGRWPGKYSGNTDPGTAHRSPGQVYSCLRVGTVGLVYLSIQPRGFSGKIEAVQVVRMSPSYLSCIGLLSLMHSLESEHNAWKSCARRDRFPCKHEVRRWWQGSDLSW